MLYSIRVQAETVPWLNLVPILESLFPVKFAFAMEHLPGLAGEVFIDDQTRRAKNNRITVSSFEAPRGDSSSCNSALADIPIEFSDEPDVPFPFRGRSFRTKVAVAPRILSLSRKQKALARSEGAPVWTLSGDADVKHFRSGFALPQVPLNGNLQDVLNGDRFMELLPLLHWIRAICAGTEYEGPPLRASFIFDDPNLHWPRYGFVDFRQIAAHAARENYHVSFATIPLDTWFTHKATAELFRTNTDRLSLAIHGNDHTNGELARNYTQSARVCLLKQAILRIERLERAADLRVCRVMVPPHGACSEEMLAELPRCGFEAAFISHGSLRAHNRLRSWTCNLGYLPTELIQGCPVLPRWGFAGNTENTILLAAYLKQPIILRGHHGDLKDGIALLDKWAKFINGLGTVTWSNLTDLSRANYSWRLHGDTFRLKPLSQKLSVPLPQEARRLLIQSPSRAHKHRWRLTDPEDSIFEVSDGESISLTGGPSRTLLIETVTEPSAKSVNGSIRSTPWPHIRRFLTEGRDRLFLDA